MEEFLCLWEKKTRIYLLDFYGNFSHCISYEAPNYSKENYNYYRSYMVSGKYYL